MSELGVYVFGDDEEEWVVASSPEDAAVVYKDHVGDALPSDDRPGEWRRLPDHESLTIGEEDSCEKTTNTCAEWAESNGRGYLCSANW